MKGDFCNGVHLIQSRSQQQRIEKHNRDIINKWLKKGEWDGILLGNIDLLGAELLHWLLT